MTNPLLHPFPAAAATGARPVAAGPAPEQAGLCVTIGDGILRMALCGDAPRLTRGAATALGQSLRAEIRRALDLAAGGDVRAIVLSLDGWDWALDDDRTGPATAGADDDWSAICARLSSLAVPVIATASGTIAGDAIAPLLAADYLVAQADARLALPQAGLGRLPAGGGLGRLAGRVGAARALELVLTRRSMGARRALALGLVDSVSVPDPAQTAETMARLIASGRQGLPPRSPAARAFADPEPYLDGVAAVRGHLARMRPARARLVARVAEVIEAQILLAGPSVFLFEAEAWALQRQDPAAAALGHLAWAARAAAMALPRQGRRLRAVTVLGGTPLAADLAHGLITAGMGVTLVTPEGPALAECLRRIAVAQDAAVRHGHLTEERREQDWARLQAGLDPTRSAGADLVIEATGLPDAGAALELARAGSVGRRGALLLTTHNRDLARLDLPSGRHGPVCGFVLPEPLGAGHLVEIALPPSGAAPDPNATAALATLAVLAHRLGRIAIRVRAGQGGLAGSFRAEGLAAIRAGLAFGLPVAGVAGCLSRLGWALPLADLLPDLPPDLPPDSDGGLAGPEARWHDWIVAALANLGARLIEEGAVTSAAEVDLIATEGAGLARDTGGPMHMADGLGLVHLRALLRERAAAGDASAAPRPLWDHHIRNARRFTGSDLRILVAGPATA